MTPMSSELFTRIEALTTKAGELVDKGHLLRAAEYYVRAAEAAQPLGEDNLVALHMRLQQSNLVGASATAAVDAATADPRVEAAHRTECIALISGAVAALERRRAAGTLLAGKCAVAEEVWCARQYKLADPRMQTARAAGWGALVGHDQFLRAAKNTLEVLARARWYAAECSAAQFQSFAQHAVLAAELMQQPRRNGDVAMHVENPVCGRAALRRRCGGCSWTRRAPGAAAGGRVAEAAAQRRAAGAPH